MQQKIQFKQERDFGSVLGDSLKFIKQNFKSFFGNLIIIVGPFLLLMGLSYGYMQSSLNSFRTNPMGGLSNFTADYFISIGAMLVFSFITHTLLLSYVYHYLGLYNDKPIEEKITLSEIGARMKSNIGSVIGSILLFSLAFGAVIGIITLVCIAIVALLGIGGGILIGFAVFFAILIFMPILFYFIPAGFYLVVRDKMSIFSALGKVRKYMKDNFWWTWLIMVVVMISLMILNVLFSLPATVVSMIDMFSGLNRTETQNDHSIILLVLYTVSIFLTTCASSIGNITSAFHYMSLEEKQEGKGLLERIDEIK